MRKVAQPRMTLSFSSEEQKGVFLGIAKNSASVEGAASASSWVVGAVLESAGLADGSAGCLAVSDLYSGARSMSETLSDAFRSVNASVGWSFNGRDAKPLVDFALTTSLDWRIVYDRSSSTKVHMLNALDSVVSAIELSAKGKGADGDKLRIEANHGRALLDEVKSGDWDMPASNLVSYLVSNWEEVGSNKHSYGLLGDLFEGSTGWRDVTGEKARNAAVSAELGYDYREHTMNFGEDVCRRRKELARLVKEVFEKMNEAHDEYVRQRWGR